MEDNNIIRLPEAASMRRGGMLLEFGTFFGVGAVSTAAHYGLLFALVRSLGIGVIAASTAGACLGAAVNYCLNYFYTFRSSKRHSKAVFIFIAIALCAFALNAVVLAAAMGQAGLSVPAAQILATAVVFVWNYLANRQWTF